MNSMLNPQKFNDEVREKQIDLMLKAMGPTNEKSAFLLAILIKQSDDPVSFINKVNEYIEAVFGANENTDKSVGSTFSEMGTMYREAISIYHQIKDI